MLRSGAKSFSSSSLTSSSGAFPCHSIAAFSTAMPPIAKRSAATKAKVRNTAILGRKRGGKGNSDPAAKEENIVGLAPTHIDIEGSDMLETSNQKTVTWASESQLEETRLISPEREAASLVSTLSASSVETPGAPYTPLGLIEHEVEEFMLSAAESVAKVVADPQATTRFSANKEGLATMETAAILSKPKPLARQPTHVWTEADLLVPGAKCPPLQTKRNRSGSFFESSEDSLPPAVVTLRPIMRNRKKAMTSMSVPPPSVPDVINYRVDYIGGLLNVTLGFGVSFIDAKAQWALNMRFPIGYDGVFAFKYASDTHNAKPVHLTERTYIDMLSEVKENMKLVALGTKGVKTKVPVAISNLGPGPNESKTEDIGKGKGTKGTKSGGYSSGSLGKNLGLLLSKPATTSAILENRDSDGSTDDESKAKARRHYLANKITIAFYCGAHGGKYCYVSHSSDPHPGVHLQMDLAFIQFLAKYMTSNPHLDLDKRPIQLPAAIVAHLEKKNAGAISATGKGKGSSRAMPHIQIHNHMGVGKETNEAPHSTSRVASSEFGNIPKLHLLHESYPTIATFLVELQTTGGAHDYLQYQDTFHDLGGFTIAQALSGIQDQVRWKCESLGGAFISLMAGHGDPIPLFTASSFCRNLENAVLQYEQDQGF